MDTGDVKRKIRENNNKYFLKHDGKKRILIVKNVGISDVGKYRCIVKYESKYSSNITEVDVKHDAEDDITETNAIGPRYESDSKLYQQKNADEKSPKCSIPDHTSADFLIAYATPEGSQAWRHTHNGSWFINAIVWAFKYHAHEDELQHLLLRVNRLVGTGCTSSNDKTVAEVKSSLRKKVFFFPGVYGNPPQEFKNNNLY
ncbi:caspase-3-like isoform X2 [Mytilus trossulus]|uniref:caspase-3-like isoform X2 n=1 Tax=Mytilus trossulus TaxID=6551 RepID=UPI003006CBDC